MTPYTLYRWDRIDNEVLMIATKRGNYITYNTHETIFSRPYIDRPNFARAIAVPETEGDLTTATSITGLAKYNTSSKTLCTKLGFHGLLVE